ncbi:hypothetical protein KC906_01885 [Candidatus Kaiserbacteria bacterium]|nr:hypothetical protein [Candidatus Kaiserbacteria bacterium]MCB9812044.1 hypothetical protein [Candidatus Nomurabacteria bacterium]
MIPFIVFITTLVVVLAVILNIFRSKKQATGGVVTGLSGGFSKLMSALPGGNGAQLAFAVALAAAVFLSWDWIQELVVNWLPDSNGGRMLGITKELVNDWLWVVPMAAIVWFLTRNIAGETAKRFVSGTIMALALLGISMSVLTGETVHNIKTGNTKAAIAMRAPLTECKLAKDLDQYTRNVRADKGMCIYVSASDQRFGLYSKAGKKLTVSFKDNTGPLASEDANDFFTQNVRGVGWNEFHVNQRLFADMGLAGTEFWFSTPQ